MPSKTLEPHIVETLRRCAWEILETMVMLTPSSVEPHVESGATFEGGMIGLLGFTGTKSGTFVVRTDAELARLMTAKMLMTEPDLIENLHEIDDAFGELVNMLCGSFKNDWVANGNQMDLTVPHVIRDGRVNINADRVNGVRSGIRLQIEEATVDIGVYFEA
ncbi:MAG: chemotaxis protein CheX [Planctomycetes bacterium]|nr:chemotaxis protein CheX [Planctomycetota bacterium]